MLREAMPRINQHADHSTKQQRDVRFEAVDHFASPAPTTCHIRKPWVIEYVAPAPSHNSRGVHGHTLCNCTATVHRATRNRL